MCPESSDTSMWPHTQWTRLGDHPGSAGADAGQLDELIKKYFSPLKTHLERKFPWLGPEAEMLVTEFSEDRMLKEGWLQQPKADKGRFRDFLKRSLENFVKDRLRRDGLHRHEPLDELTQEPSMPAPTAPTFDLVWTQTVLAQALGQMEADCKDPKKDQPRRGYIWGIFQVRMLEPILEDAKPMPYEELVTRYELKSVTEATNMLLTAKRMFARHLNDVIAEYEGKGAAQLEIEELKRFLSRLMKKK